MHEGVDDTDGPERGHDTVDLRKWLRAAPTPTPAAAVDALQRDQLRRWPRGERVPAETYLRLLEAVGADDELALDLICAEVLLRRELGETPSLDEYQWRFPEHSDRIALLFELEGQLGEHRTATAPLTAVTAVNI